MTCPRGKLEPQGSSQSHLCWPRTGCLGPPPTFTYIHDHRTSGTLFAGAGFWGFWRVGSCWYFFLLTNFHLLPLSYGRLPFRALASDLDQPPRASLPQQCRPPFGGWGWGGWECCSVNTGGIECKMNKTTLTRRNLSLVGEGYRENGGNCVGTDSKDMTDGAVSQSPQAAWPLPPGQGSSEAAQVSPQDISPGMQHALTWAAPLPLAGRWPERHCGVFWVVNAQVAAGLCPTLPRGLPNPFCLPRKTHLPGGAAC